LALESSFHSCFQDFLYPEAELFVMCDPSMTEL
jgi:hypothetical protein